MIHKYLDAVLLGFGLAFMVGPVFFTLIETSIVKGARAALVFDMGVVLADVTFICIAYFGSLSILRRIENNSKLYLFGGLILIIYGLVTIFYKGPKREVTNKNLVLVKGINFMGLFVKGFFLNFINVGVLGFWLAIVIAISSVTAMNTARIFNYFAVVISSYLITDLVKIVTAKQLKSKLTPVVLLKIRKYLGMFFVVFGFILASKKYIPQEFIQRFENLLH